jgi:hypothetical protein
VFVQRDEKAKKAKEAQKVKKKKKQKKEKKCHLTLFLLRRQQKLFLSQIVSVFFSSLQSLQLALSFSTLVGTQSFDESDSQLIH